LLPVSGRSLVLVAGIPGAGKSTLMLGPAATVVVHLPATSARLRRAVTALARLSRRTAYLVWLDVSVAEARDGQRARGRIVAARSFERHARPAGQASEQI